MKHVQIDRTKWIRGDKNNSMLYRPSDDKSCCVGLVCEALGVSKTDMAHVGTVEDLVSPGREVKVPSEFTIENAEAHTCNCEHCNSSMPAFSERFTLSELYAINDSEDLNNTERESTLIPLFASLGIEVEFIN